MDYDLALDCFNRVLDYHYDDSETLLEIYSCSTQIGRASCRERV